MGMKLGLTFKGRQRLKVFMNSMLRKILGWERGINRTRKNCLRSFMICTQQIQLKMNKSKMRYVGYADHTGDKITVYRC
jgi:hypothetical protein